MDTKRLPEPDDLIGPLREDQIVNTNPINELWEAKPLCRHHIICAPGGGIKCTKCGGWFCF